MIFAGAVSWFITPRRRPASHSRNEPASRATAGPDFDDREGRVMSWYVLYKERAANALQRLDDRGSALSAAFALAYGGYEVIELGRIGGRGAEAVAGAAMTNLLAEFASGGLPQSERASERLSLAANRQGVS